MEPHCLQHAVPWSLDICSTQRSPVHWVQMHGTSNRDIHLYPPHNFSSVHLTTTTYVRRSGRITNGMRSGRTTAQDIFIPHTGTHPTGMTLSRRACVRFNRLRSVCRAFPLLLEKIGYGLLCGLWVWRRRTNCWPCCTGNNVHLLSAWGCCNSNVTRKFLQLGLHYYS